MKTWRVYIPDEMSGFGTVVDHGAGMHTVSTALERENIGLGCYK